ncbi:MAG: alpha/beta hydrolase [Deltaproteobacteria bacterium]|nr:alpha/beta hydrolase [Deltaproteobacteria bacterium]
MPKTLFMVHGMWGTGADWEFYRPFFEARGYRCLTPSLRHHAVPPQAPPPPGLGSLSVLDYASDLEAEIRKLPEPPILMGHSMGGLLVQMLAARGLGKAAVLLAPASPRGILALRISVVRSFFTHFLRWGFWRKPYRQTRGEAIYSMLHLLPEARREKVLSQFVHESGRPPAEIGLWIFDPHKATRVDAAKVTCPMLVVAGVEDRITPSAVVRKVAQRYGARVTFKEFGGHAHRLMDETGWEEIAAFCAEWMKQNGL